MLTLRTYQLECLETIISAQQVGINRQIIHLPTASGKTVIFAYFLSKHMKVATESRALILAFSCDLLGQARDKLKMVDSSMQVGIVNSDCKEFDRQIVVSSIQSARQPENLEQLRAQGFSICICDECHHFASSTARFVLRELGFSKIDCESTGRLLLGFSATPFRQDGRGLAEDFDKIVYSRTIKEMIADGYLAKPIGRKVFTDLDLSKIAIEAGDFSSSALSKVMNTPEINQLVVNSYMEQAYGRKTIAFCCSIEHSNTLAEWFQKFGIRAASIHSQLSSQERESLKAHFVSGEIEVLCNPLMLTEGYDEPSIEGVIVARPTRSPGLYQQMVGRGLRLYPNKRDCLILDFSDQNHTLCNVGVLLDDQNDDGKHQDRKEDRLKEIVLHLPLNINEKLKRAILDYDLLGESFTWQKDLDGCYCLKAAGDAVLKIAKRNDDRYDAIMSGSRGIKIIAENLDFEYCFCAAEEFAKANRSLFAVSDLDAPWRSLPISDKQKELFSSAGFRNGIDDLTRGQAAQIIGSGILRKRKAQNV